MIEVENLSKWYGDFQALRDISFAVRGQQIAGFLGANGAGKTTTMRILACFLPATSGRASVGGHDVFADSMAVRQVLGYMPQSSPMYSDMRVEEYLRYMAEMRDVPAHRLTVAVQEAMHKSGLLRPEDMHRRLIGTLSGGYRQRVGLAAALLHQPRVLILDEPTAGLDPVEIRNTRQVIRNLASEHTVLLSTHILSEVQQICSKVVIIRGGTVIADSGLDELVRREGRPRVFVTMGESRATTEEIVAALSEVAGARQVAPTGVANLHMAPPVGGDPAMFTEPTPATPAADAGNPANDAEATDSAKTAARTDTKAQPPREFVVLTEAGCDVRPAIASLLAQRDWPLLEMRLQPETLEDIYVRLTQTER